MVKKRTTFFISDLHLDESCPEMTDQFFTLLLKAKGIDALYILGDFFESWVGDDNDTPFNLRMVSALRSTTQNGVPIFFMRGNRDFLVGKKFMRATGCYLLSDEEKITLYGTSILLMHGDTLCTLDKAYLKTRRIFRNPIAQFIFLRLPISKRRELAIQLRSKGKAHTQKITLEKMDVTQDAVNKVMQAHQVNYLIHGHTHRPGMHQFKLRQNVAERIVLPAWHNKGCVLAWDESGQKRWIDVNSLE